MDLSGITDRIVSWFYFTARWGSIICQGLACLARWCIAGRDVNVGAQDHRPRAEMTIRRWRANPRAIERYQLGLRPQAGDVEAATAREDPTQRHAFQVRYGHSSSAAFSGGTSGRSRSRTGRSHASVEGDRRISTRLERNDVASVSGAIVSISSPLKTICLIRDDLLLRQERP